jgi:nucleotide-binding universal stress UspA family protein
MRRVLVPLDGTYFAESIIPDALRLAGPTGELIIVRDASHRHHDPDTGEFTEQAAVEASDRYLETLRQRLHGIKIRAETFVMGSAASAIEEALHMYHPDMIACATHGRTSLGRIVHGGVAWKALTHSHVPVLVRHPRADGETESVTEPGTRHILVPLDGSKLAESALQPAYGLTVRLPKISYLRPKYVPVQIDR